MAVVIDWIVNAIPSTAMNPYAPPTAPVDGPTLDADRAKLRDIARHQRTINLMILAQFLLYLAAAATREVDGSAFVVGLVALVILALSLLATFRLAGTLYTTPMAILYGILMFAPCIGLIVLLLLNQEATRRLRNAGFKVGLLGADPKQFG
jgi:hypothetical protein